MLEFTLGPIRTQADDSIGNMGPNDISLRWRGSETLVERKLLPRSRCDIPPHYSKAEIGFLGFTQKRIMPNDADGPKSKNTRKRGQNVKNGCVTCKWVSIHLSQVISQIASNNSPDLENNTPHFNSQTISRKTRTIRVLYPVMIWLAPFYIEFATNSS